MLVPSKIAPPEYAALGFVPSFGLGTLMTASLVTLYSVVPWGKLCTQKPEREAERNDDTMQDTGSYREDDEEEHSTMFSCYPPVAIVAGIASGMIYNAGSICTIMAMTVGELSYGIAFPIFQSALVFSGLWGLFLFKEIRGTAPILLFFASVAVVVGGVILLSKYGPQQ